MIISHDALVLVADGRKRLLLRNGGSAEEIALRVEEHETHDSPADRDQKSDAAGAASSTQGGGTFAPSRGTIGETDFHQQEEDRFAIQTADLVNRMALESAFETLVVVAPPQVLGTLRKHYHGEVKARLVGELNKDLTSMPVPDIEQALLAA
ncbi:host attachment family protein [Novosphingobium terrae]|uniref:host attachment family protein n=1 Tax=Novosphingobium terrae TaxID=2726189 RepID=UPI00197E7B56|nr:host attachment family protein [Novosphingobium terrae]